MQLALTPEVLFPLGACAVVAAAVIAVVVVLVRSRSATTEEALPPTSADWTGEAATAEPARVDRPALPALPPRLTVAEAIAVREADTAPLPITSAAYVRARPAVSPPAVADAESGDPVEAGPERAEQSSTAPSPAEGAAVATPDPPTPVEPPAAPEAEAEPIEAEGGVEPAEPRGAVAAPRAGTPATASGSSATVATAVAHVLAVRAAAGREPVEPAVPSRTADARDRLLAVLLADPARAVGAAEELATCRGQLGDVLSRLAASGLTTEQLARLSGFSMEQITTLMDRQNA